MVYASQGSELGTLVDPLDEEKIRGCLHRGIRMIRVLRQPASSKTKGGSGLQNDCVGPKRGLGGSVEHGLLEEGEAGLVDRRFFLEYQGLSGGRTKLHGAISSFLEENLTVRVFLYERGHRRILEKQILQLSFGKLGEVGKARGILSFPHFGNEGLVARLKMGASLYLGRGGDPFKNFFSEGNETGGYNWIHAWS